MRWLVLNSKVRIRMISPSFVKKAWLSPSSTLIPTSLTDLPGIQTEQISIPKERTNGHGLSRAKSILNNHCQTGIEHLINYFDYSDYFSAFAGSGSSTHSALVQPWSGLMLRKLTIKPYFWTMDAESVAFAWLGLGETPIIPSDQVDILYLSSSETNQHDLPNRVQLLLHEEEIQKL